MKLKYSVTVLRDIQCLSMEVEGPTRAFSSLLR